MTKDLPYSQKQTGLFDGRIDKDNNWSTLVKIACMYTNYCLSFFIMKIHLLGQLCKQKHAETTISKQCGFPHMPELPLQASLLWTTLYPFLTSYCTGEISLTWCQFCISRNRKHTSIEASMMSYSGFALLLEQDTVMHFGFHIFYAKLRHSFTKRRQF